MRFCLFIILSFVSIQILAADVVRYPWLGYDKFLYDDYYQKLLKLALDKSKDKYGEYELEQVRVPTNQGRAVDLIQHNKYINVFWTMTSKEREDSLMPVRIPLFKGLGGCRVFLVNDDQVNDFKTLSLTQLKKRNAGQGHDWPDTKILAANGFTVSTGREHDGMFSMLQHRRFDYFPRAIYEAINEVSLYEGLALDEHFILYYDSPMFFFVSKDNQALHDRLSYGLKVAINDGSFEQFFESHSVSKALFDRISLSEREFVRLDNPLMTEDTHNALSELGFASACEPFDEIAKQ